MQMVGAIRAVSSAAGIALACGVGLPLAAQTPTVAIDHDESAGKLAVVIDDQPAVTYQYGRQYALPHYWPLRSPTGKSLTAQHPEPYPHHRSVWIADKVQAGDGPVVDFYHCWKNYNTADDPASGCRHFIRHCQFQDVSVSDGEATVSSTSSWIVNQSQAVLTERRRLRVTALGGGEYVMDLSWQLTPVDADVRFLSDWVHYAWPYLRMAPEFSVERGGTLQSDAGRRGQKETNGEPARWIDYSNTVEGTAEGLTVFLFPDGERHKWLTRDYGTFGPRRAERYSGTQFVLRQGESLDGRVGILVHRGDVDADRVVERVQQYIEQQQ